MGFGFGGLGFRGLGSKGLGYRVIYLTYWLTRFGIDGPSLPRSSRSAARYTKCPDTQM